MGIVVDTAAAAARPSPEAIAAWAGDQRVFISSAMSDLAAEREAVANEVQAIGAEPVWFENFGGRDDDASAAYLAEVRSSTVYLGIVGRSYGTMLPSRYSATHEEYREAEKQGLRICVWARRDGDFQGDQKAFLNEVRLFHTTGQYSSADDLATRVTERLYAIAADDLSPWVKLGTAVFRAHEVADDGKAIVVRASVHGPDVVAALEAMRPSVWAGQHEARLSYAGRSAAVRVKEIVTRVTASRATEVDIKLLRAKDNEPTSYGFSANLLGKSYSSADVLELYVRKALFGERLPTGLLSIGQKIGDPLSDMPSEKLPNGTYAAVLALIVTEAIVGSGGASRVTKIRVSPLGPDGRRVALEWVTATNGAKAGEVRAVDGFLTS